MSNAKHGDVIQVHRWRSLYSHFGVYAETPHGPRVIHYCNTEGPSDFYGIVRETAVEKFLNGAEEFNVYAFDPKEYPRIYSGKETVERARSRLGDGDYHLLWNNCEHFTTWCKTGQQRSAQIERIGAVLLSTVFQHLKAQPFWGGVRV